MSKAISLRLPEDLIRRLDELSRSTKRPKSFLIREALENYLEEYGEYREALDRLLVKDDRLTESAELRKRLGL